MADPIKQFEIKPLIPIKMNDIDLSFTNSSLFMVIAVFVAIFFLFYATRKKSIIPGASQSFAEVLYQFVDSIMMENIGIEGKKFFPLIFTIFLFIACGNLIGVIPYTFTYTSHASVVGGVAVFSLILNTVVGIKKKGWGWLHTFLPHGTPIIAAPIVVPIEIVSFLSKPFSLTVRLVANMMVGHIMLKVIAGFVVKLKAFGFVPLIFICILVLFEAGIAFLQAYIFTVLSCIYLNEALHDH
ncbi:MAG: ATP synthase subunit a [Alphaproteobacteria bacterium ADurb.Bin438]|nr:MAG: ATP synthase subunit a [Alphaproteobacteria bacterium ADurb.Bin438]